jgi:hypothetical protein
MQWADWGPILYWMSRIAAAIGIPVSVTAYAVYETGGHWTPWAQAVVVLMQVAIISKALLRHCIAKKEDTADWSAQAQDGSETASLSR